MERTGRTGRPVDSLNVGVALACPAHRQRSGTPPAARHGCINAFLAFASAFAGAAVHRRCARPSRSWLYREAAQGGLSLPGMAREIGELAAHAKARTGARGRPFGRCRGHDPHDARRHYRAARAGQSQRCADAFSWSRHAIFSPLAKLLVLNPFVPRVFSWHASDRAAVERLIRNTGSVIDDAGIRLYSRLVSNPGHVAAALAMMANWNLDPLFRDLPRLKTPLLLVACGEDRAISGRPGFRVRERLPTAKMEYLRGLGHLAHEERPNEIARLIDGMGRVLQVLSKT